MSESWQTYINMDTGERFTVDTNDQQAMNALPIGTYRFAVTSLLRPVTWKDENGQTIFTQTVGSEIELAEGQTWESAFRFFLAMYDRVQLRGMQRLDDGAVYAYQMRQRLLTPLGDVPTEE